MRYDLTHGVKNMIIKKRIFRKFQSQLLSYMKIDFLDQF